MVVVWKLVAGGVAVAIGLAWVAAPVRMSHLQSRVLYFGRGNEIEGTEQEATVGRVSGALLVALGLLLASGFEL